MANSEDIINWPFTDPTSPTKEAVTAVKAVQPRTPYQPHHGYIQAAQKYAIRKRLTVYVVSLAVAVFSDIVSITLYILVGLHEHEYAWLFRAWLVVSAGLTVLFALLAASFWFNYRRAKRLEGSDQGEKDTPLKALGRKGLFDSFSWAGEVVDADAGEEARRESQSVAKEPLVKHGNDHLISLRKSQLKQCRPRTARSNFSSHRSPSPRCVQRSSRITHMTLPLTRSRRNKPLELLSRNQQHHTRSERPQIRSESHPQSQQRASMRMHYLHTSTALSVACQALSRCSA